MKNANPTWTGEQVVKGKPHRRGGKFIYQFLSLYTNREESNWNYLSSNATFNTKTIDRIARCGKSNVSEAFFGNIVHSILRGIEVES